MDPDKMELFPQDPGAEGVEGGNPAFVEASGEVTEDPVSELPCGFFGERQGKDLLHPGPPFEEPADQDCDRSRLSGSGARDDKPGPLESVDHVTLLRIQSCKVLG